MRGVKDEEKVISPMFPRLHVNDTEKGGPRAPPRNKMALYEQLSIPSQRFSSGSASMLPLPPSNASSLLPSMCSSHGGGHETSVFTSFCNTPAPSHLAEKLFLYSSRGVTKNTTMAGQKGKSMNATTDQTLNSMRPLSSRAKRDSAHSHSFSNFESIPCKKLGEENDFTVPSSAQSGAVLHRSNSQHSRDRENQACLNLSFFMQFQSVSEKEKKGTGAIDVKAREFRKKQFEDNIKVTKTCLDRIERSASVPSVKDKTLADSSSSPSGKDRSIESLKCAHPSSNREHRRSSAHVLKSMHCTNPRLNQELVSSQEKTVVRDNPLVDPKVGIGKKNASNVRNESCMKLSVGEDNGNLTGLEKDCKYREDKKCVRGGDVARHDDVSETSVVDSIWALNVTPDDVVGVIGEKQFWKARSAIVNQQRVFAVQVFELHRLIKVQKIIAGSPHLLLEDNFYLGKTSLKVSQVKKLPSEYAIEPPSLTVKSKDNSQNSEFADENAIGKLPVPSVNNENCKGPLTQQSNYGSNSESALPAPMATNAKPSPWCFPPPGNQWLVPVMSPSEGLVYKPCPPTAGFMAPVYGSCGPISTAPGGGDFWNVAYGVPASHQEGTGILPCAPPLGQTYFPPYGMPVINPSVSGSAVDQVSPFTESHSKENQLSVGNINFIFPYQSSCNMSSQMSQVISCCIGKFQALKEIEVLGSTASSPSKRAKGDPLPLFPTEPTVQASDQNPQTNDQQTHVIKVVPHNPRSATESAARIFRSIQEERKQYE